MTKRAPLLPASSMFTGGRCLWHHPRCDTRGGCCCRTAASSDGAIVCLRSCSGRPSHLPAPMRGKNSRRESAGHVLPSWFPLGHRCIRDGSGVDDPPYPTPLTPRRQKSVGSLSPDSCYTLSCRLVATLKQLDDSIDCPWLRRQEAVPRSSSPDRGCSRTSERCRAGTR